MSTNSSSNLNTRRRLHEGDEDARTAETEALRSSMSSQNETKHERRRIVPLLLLLKKRVTISTILVLIPFVILCVYCGHRIAANYKGHRNVHVLTPIHYIERPCPLPTYKTLAQELAESPSMKPPKICLTTLTDEKERSRQQAMMRWRNFDGLLELTWKNKQDYANKHGYYLYDESSGLDRSRPPSWSKIKAVQRLHKEENCTWVWWVDADTVIMNSAKKLEDFLPSSTSDHDFLLAKDFTDEFNAGGWIMRNSNYGRYFLQLWWDQKEFVKPIGLSKSGDNDALKAMLRNEKVVPAADKEKHIFTPAPCVFNPLSKFLTPAKMEQIDREGTLTKQDWYMSEAFYHKGDILSHVAGLDNKEHLINLLLAIAE